MLTCLGVFWESIILMMKYLVLSAALILGHMTSVAYANSLNTCIHNDDKSSATLHMDMRNWLVLKREGKSLTARIIGHAKEHNGFVIGHSKPIKSEQNSYVHIFSYHPEKLTLDIKAVIVASDAVEKLSDLISVSRYKCKK